MSEADGTNNFSGRCANDYLLNGLHDDSRYSLSACSNSSGEVCGMSQHKCKCCGQNVPGTIIKKTRFFNSKAEAESVANELRSGEPKSPLERWSYLVESSCIPNQWVISVFDENVEWIGCWGIDE